MKVGPSGRVAASVGLGIAITVAVVMLRSVSPTQIESYYVGGEGPVERFRIATHYGSISEIWVLPAADTRVSDLVSLPEFESRWLLDIYKAYADGTSIADLVVSDALRAPLLELLASPRDTALQVVIQADCGRASIHLNAEQVEYMVVAPPCQDQHPSTIHDQSTDPVFETPLLKGTE